MSSRLVREWLGTSVALSRRQAAGHLSASAELGERVPTKSLTAWFSERLHRLHDLANTN
jgi:hypothetical protein